MKNFDIDTECYGKISIVLDTDDFIGCDDEGDHYGHLVILDKDLPVWKEMKLKITRCDLLSLRAMIDYVLDDSIPRRPTVSSRC
jgi:hypothetical protein